MSLFNSTTSFEANVIFNCSDGLFFFFEKMSYYIVLVGLEPRDLPAFAYQLLGLKACKIGSN